jgi:hypothetical protein
MINAGSQWLRERTCAFRDRAEQVEDEEIRTRLLSAAVIYDREADLIDTKGQPRRASTTRVVSSR